MPASARAPDSSAGTPAVVRDHAPDSIFRAYTLPPSASSSTHLCLRRGTLLLVGGGPSQDDLQAELMRVAGGERAKLVVIPTASLEGGDSTTAKDIGEKLGRAFGAKQVAVLHTFSRRIADSEEFAKPLLDATAVWPDDLHTAGIGLLRNVLVVPHFSEFRLAPVDGEDRRDLPRPARDRRRLVI